MPPPRRRPAAAFDRVTSAPLDSRSDATGSAARAFDKVLARSDSLDDKSKVKRLFLYDASLKAAASVADLLYPGSKVARFDTWSRLVTELSRYSEAEELVIWAHSGAGGLLILDSPGVEHVRSPQATRDLLGKSKLRVTRALHFEGCNIMRQPRDVAIIASGLVGPSALVTGYTYYMLVGPLAANGLDSARASALVQKWGGFLIGPPAASSLVGGQHTLYLRFFSQEVADIEHPPSLPDPPTNLRKVEFSKLSELEPQLLTSSAEVTAFLELLEAPVQPGYSVTLKNVAALAAGK